MSLKTFAILQILDEKHIINTDNDTQFVEYEVLWEDKTTSWVKEEDMSEDSLKNYHMLKEFNQTIVNISHNNAGLINNKKAFVYGRISNKTQSGNYFESLETQREACFDYCIKNSMKIDTYACDNGVSGKDFKNYKYELGFLSKHLKPFENILIVYTPDRFGRCAGKCINFLDGLVHNNIDIYFVKERILYNKSTESQDKNTIHTMLVQAENFSNMTSERIKNTYKAMKIKGHYFGRAPTGYEVFKSNNGIRKLRKNDDEQKIIKIIIKEYKKKLVDNINTKKQVYLFIEHYLKNQNLKIRGKEIKSATIKRLINKEINNDISNVMTSMYINSS